MVLSSPKLGNLITCPTPRHRITRIRTHRFGRPMRLTQTNQKRCQWSHQNTQSRHHWTNHHRRRRQSPLDRFALANSLWREGNFVLIWQNVPYVFVPSKKALGAACGTTRNVITVSIVKNKFSKVNEEIQRIVGECERLFISSWTQIYST